MSSLLSRLRGAGSSARSKAARSKDGGERPGVHPDAAAAPAGRTAGPRSAGRPAPSSQAVVFQAAALVLAYPDAELIDRLDLIEEAVASVGALEPFVAVLAHLRGQSLPEAQAYHVQEFDLSRRHALHLSYWTEGDTRRRGEVLAEIKQVYRDSGLVVDTRGELPDHLPMVLEFAVADPQAGMTLLERFRAGLELIRLGLAKDDLPHAGVLTAVCDCLPGASPQSLAEVQARFGQARPLEFVGLSEVVRN